MHDSHLFVPGRGIRLNFVELGIFARWHTLYAWQNAWQCHYAGERLRHLKSR
jgi:hypothetical protein